jgi:hypothetical protein
LKKLWFIAMEAIPNYTILNLFVISDTGLRAAQLLKVDLLHQFRTPHKYGKPLLRKRVACPEGLILGGFCKPIGATT